MTCQYCARFEYFRDDGGYRDYAGKEGECRLNPEYIAVSEDHICGQFVPTSWLQTSLVGRSVYVEGFRTEQAKRRELGKKLKAARVQIRELKQKLKGLST